MICVARIKSRGFALTIARESSARGVCTARWQTVNLQKVPRRLLLYREVLESQWKIVIRVRHQTAIRTTWAAAIRPYDLLSRENFNKWIFGNQKTSRWLLSTRARFTRVRLTLTRLKIHLKWRRSETYYKTLKQRPWPNCCRRLFQYPEFQHEIEKSASSAAWFLEATWNCVFH